MENADSEIKEIVWMVLRMMAIAPEFSSNKLTRQVVGEQQSPPKMGGLMSMT